MKLRAMDLIIELAPRQTELLSHSAALAGGFQFLCSHISLERFLEDDQEIETPSRSVLAVPNENGVNFYAKEPHKMKGQQ